MGAVANVPQNQIDALPLRTVSQAATDGDLQIIGGAINCFWSPTTLGLASAVFVNDATYGSNANAHFVLATPFINTAACIYFTFVIQRSSAAGCAAQGVGSGIVIKAQFRSGGTASTPPVSHATYADEFLGIAWQNSTALTLFPAIPAPANNLTQVKVYQFAPFGTTGITSQASNMPMAIGADVRFILDTSTNNPNAGDSRFAVGLWGSS